MIKYMDSADFIIYIYACIHIFNDNNMKVFMNLRVRREYISSIERRNWAGN